jgi:hypothetical protein
MRIVELEDQGQDFTELHVDENNEIINARPFQGWVWQGFQIVQGQILPGMRLRLRKRGHHPLILKYPVLSVRQRG